MISDALRIREMTGADNAQVARVIRSVLGEHEVPKIGTTYADPVLDSLFEYYDKPRAAYFVVEKGDEIVGGAGIVALEACEGNVCELQKMYFLKECRGKGIGTKMLELCLHTADKEGYDFCYLETMPHMKSALKLYEKWGFEYLEAPMGNTGHYSCKVWMIKKLKT
ncbi:MAG: GNAT family N-acetyltransferase [Eudoraea sp.]|nr:GNAT family N-acetyltransferase [Eudoraea sp.]